MATGLSNTPLSYRLGIPNCVLSSNLTEHRTKKRKAPTLAKWRKKRSTKDALASEALGSLFAFAAPLLFIHFSTSESPTRV